MKERPIIFSGEMLGAILEGRKTQTRRIIKNPKGMDYEVDWFPWYEGLSEKYPGCHQFYQPRDGLTLHLRCPHGVPGDCLYVRETWATRREWDHMKPSGLPADADLWWKADKSSYRALNAKPGKWRPSIHMPKRLARIWLEITSVRVERLQDISRDDALAEGYNWKKAGVPCLDWFPILWDDLNTKRGYGWDTNPWVWVVEFRMIDND